MTDERDPLAAFDRAVVDEVADERGIDADDLRTVVRRHQESVRDLPGVEDIVYEWRTQFHRDPLVARSEESYALSLPGHVWDEFAAALDLDDARREALIAVHRRQFGRAVKTNETDDHADETPLVLTRP